MKSSTFHFVWREKVHSFFMFIQSHTCSVGVRRALLQWFPIETQAESKLY